MARKVTKTTAPAPEPEEVEADTMDENEDMDGDETETEDEEIVEAEAETEVPESAPTAFDYLLDGARSIKGKENFRQTPREKDRDFIIRMMGLWQADVGNDVYDALPADAQAWYENFAEEINVDGGPITPPPGFVSKYANVPVKAKKARVAKEPREKKVKPPKAPRPDSAVTILERHVLSNPDWSVKELEKVMAESGRPMKVSTIGTIRNIVHNTVRIADGLGFWNGPGSAVAKEKIAA